MQVIPMKESQANFTTELLAVSQPGPCMNDKQKKYSSLCSQHVGVSAESEALSEEYQGLSGVSWTSLTRMWPASRRDGASVIRAS